MTINRVSFGKVIDIKYRYNIKDQNGKQKAYDRYESEYKSYTSLPLITNYTIFVDKNDKSSKDRLFANLGNRFLTEDDAVVYNQLKNVSGEQVAKEYADKHAETFIVDV